MRRRVYIDGRGSKATSVCHPPLANWLSSEGKLIARPSLSTLFVICPIGSPFSPSSCVGWI